MIKIHELQEKLIGEFRVYYSQTKRFNDIEFLLYIEGIRSTLKAIGIDFTERAIILTNIRHAFYIAQTENLTKGDKYKHE